MYLYMWGVISYEALIFFFQVYFLFAVMSDIRKEPARVFSRKWTKVPDFVSYMVLDKLLNFSGQFFSSMEWE